MKKKLVLITAHFPFGTSETFLESELPILAESFEKIEILTFPTKGTRREIPENCTVTNINIAYKNFHALFKIFSPLFWKEIITIRKVYKQPITFGIMKTMLISFMRGKAIARFLIKRYSSEYQQDTVYYSYWCDDSALALAFFNEHSNHTLKTVCRTHGWDVYFEVSNYNYLPFRHFIHHNLSQIFPISEKGQKYIEERWKVNGKINVSKLGVNPPPLSPSKGGINEKDIFTIVSCSNLIPLKRVHLIIEALSLIESEQIHWVHFGDGPEEKKLKELAYQKLTANISYEFKGRVTNKTILDFYSSNTPQLIINVSSSEGIPVSIMEAMSFGIPCIATNVGGNSEIVKDYCNGKLLNTSPSVIEIATVITDFKTMAASEYATFKVNAYETWEKEYNAKKNYLEFNQQLR